MQRLLIFAVWLAVGITAAIGFLFILTTPARAHTLAPQECVLLAEDVGYLFDLKTSGVTWNDAQPQLIKDVAKAYVSGKTYIKDDVDITRVMQMAEMVWKTNEKKEDVQTLVWYQCLLTWNSEAI